MKHKHTKALSILLTVCMIVGLLPWTVLPARADSSGTCGDQNVNGGADVTWTLTENSDSVPWYGGQTTKGRTLTISGTGAMKNNYTVHFLSDFYIDEDKRPWGNDRERITHVIIGDGVTSVGNSAFAGCRYLQSVTIPTSVTSIGNYAFRYCPTLTSVTIPANVKNIGNSAFQNCSGLTSITIPASVTSIGNSAFSNCTSLTGITVTNGNTSFCADGGVLFNADKTRLICYPAGKTGDSYVIPGTVTSIDNNAFIGCTNLNVTIPSGVDCSNVTFPSGVIPTQNNGDPVAQVDSTDYYSVQTAINEANGKNVTLLSNVILNAPLTISSGTVTLDLNGHTIDRGITNYRENGNVITISGGNLTLTDSSTGKTGKITGGWNNGEKGGGVYVSSGTFTMNGGTICNNYVASYNGPLVKTTN